MDYSVLMSVYADENPAFLKQSIESIVNQSYPAEQFVLVKDGPLSDDLEEVIQTYYQKNAGLFTFVSLKDNMGLGVALDRGIDACRNELIARMDSDDLSLPLRCEKQIYWFKTTKDLCLLGTNVDEFYDIPEKIVTSRIVPAEYKEIRRFARRRNPFNHSTVMFKKSAVVRCGGYGNIRYRQDYDLFSRMINQGCYALNLNESLVLFRSDANNYIRRKSWKYCKSCMDVGYRNWRRGYCSLWDLLFVICAQTAMHVMPMGIMKLVSDNFLREKQ